MSALAQTLPIEVRALSRPEECAQCEAIYRQVFGLAPGDGSLNGRLLISLGRNSGIVIGAYCGDELIGFALSFLARQKEDGRLYQYSQTAAVLPGWQGRGVGRAIKFAQRSAALAAGIDLLRWTYDPLRPANAHFNLDVLGAVVTGLIRDLYGTMAAPGDRGEPSDRFVVDWELTNPAVCARTIYTDGPAPCAALPEQQAPTALRPGELRPGDLLVSGAAAMLAIPADWRSFRRDSRSSAARLRGQILEHAEQLLDSGLVATSCTLLDSATAVYRLVRP